LLAAAAIIAIAVPGAARAYTVAPGYTAADYATGFPYEPANGWGPAGVAFDASDNLYVSDFSDGNVYRFQPGGGQANLQTQLTYPSLTGGIKGLAFTRSGHLYLARTAAHDVVELEQATGRVTRTIADGLKCPTGLAADPASDDLFVSQTCTDKLLRISNFATGPGTVSTYATPPCCSDGLAFAPDGTLYSANATGVVRIDGTRSSTPGLTRVIAQIAHADGVAVGVPGDGESPFLVVNRTNGVITRVDFSTEPATQSMILSDGSRGDFVAVNSQGCLFATQSHSIVRIRPPGGRCDLTPSTPGGGTGPGSRPGIVIDHLPSGKRRLRCIAVRRFGCASMAASGYAPSRCT
jgi:hypothetical protein